MPQNQSTIGNGQSLWGSAVSNPFDKTVFYASGGAFPVSALPHARVPSAATTFFDTNNATHITNTTISDASQPTLSRFPDGLSHATSGSGPLSAASTLNVPSPSTLTSPFVQSHVRPGNSLKNMTLLNVVKHPSTGYDIYTTSKPVASATVERKSLQSQGQHFELSTGGPSHSAAAGGTDRVQTGAKPQPIAVPSSAVNSESSSSSHRLNGSSGDVPAPKPAQVLASGSKPNDAGLGSGSGTNKPILKMRRTGQNFPLSSGASSSPLRTSASLHHRNGSYSPIGRSAPGLSIPSIHKASDPVLGKAAGSPLTENEASFLIRPLDKGADPGVPNKALTNANSEPMYEGSLKLSSGRPSEDSSGSKIGLDPIRGSSNADGGSGQSSHRLADSFSQSGKESEADQASDDEIIYETTYRTTGLDDASDLDEVAAADDSSDDDSDSASDNDETVELREPSPNGDAISSYRQLFLPPDEESDYDEDEGTVEDDAISVSSSTQSTPTAEPTVALPSANIQHQIDYPSNILEMATADRAYVTWSDETVSFKKSGGAIFPDGYEKCTEIPKHPWVCPVRSCRLVYKTHKGLLNHFKFTHKRAMFNDNMDGTLSLVGSYTQKNKSGTSPPVVVSKRPIDPKEPPMLEPSIPKKNHGSKVSSISLETTLTASSRKEEDISMANVEAASPELLQHRSPPANTDPDGSKEMWEYIRPFLEVHKAIPDKNWVRHVIHLPRIREIKWNEERNKEHPYRDSHPRDITALIVYVTGVEAPMPCSQCAGGKGPFVGCIMISSDASEESKASILSCANCYYHSGQSLCSHKNDLQYRKERGSRESQQDRSYNLKLLSDKAAGRVATSTTAQPQASLVKSPDPTLSTMPSTSSPMKLFEPSEINNIEMASHDRTYKVFPGKDGELEQMNGALIPDKPVSGNTCPALVVSKNPLEKTEPPMAKARVLKDKHAKPAKMERLSSPTPEAVANVDNTVADRNAKELWDYMLPYLPRPLTTFDDPRIHKVFEQPRVRSIKWREMRTRRTGNDWREVAGLLIHLVGVDCDGPVGGCTACRRGQGPFEGCQVLPPQAPYESSKFLKSCANCLFSRQKDHCSIKSGWERRCGTRPDRTPLSAPPIAEWAAAIPTSSSNETNNIGINQNNKRPYVGESDDEREVRKTSRRRSERMKDRPLEVPEPVRKLVTLPMIHKEKHTSATGVLRTGDSMAASSTLALVSAGQTTPDGLLEMEEWEIAPGCVREAGVDQPNNIAFSKSYLETKQAVRISPELSFRVETVKSGRTLDFEAEKGRTRFCSVASGKLRVSLEGQPEFTIGTHGLFKINPGVKGWVQNRLYMDSILHVNTIESES
ncbi:hypothetical protein VP1G_06169 [Cytospora mali]|uniref:C2H2-type domain-containing protein n=1 Tax=Cytospora mali TaxID=578113 RepID=A0A194V4N9_CYTMA|nr:hypothetical protein VP1G_06169 [Valsa mali var. pyri (nom. inval.)]